MRQQLLNRLAAAYAAGAVVVFGLDEVSGDGASNPAGPTNLFGHPQASVGADAATKGNGGTLNQNFTLSTGRIPLGPPTVITDATKTYDPRLAFTFVSKNVQGAAYVPLDLGLKVSHLEFDRTLVPGIEGYVQSRWLAFVNGPFEYDLGTSTSNIPVVNRALPVPPTVRQQSGTKPATKPKTVGDLAKWDYSFEFVYDLAAGDSVNVDIRLNPDSSAFQAQMLPEEKTLFGALAQFVSSYPAISSDLATYLPKLGRGETDQATIDGAKKAVEAFQTYVSAVAAAYASSLQPSRAAGLGDEALEQVTVTFEVLLEPDDDGNARTDIVSLEIDGTAATWDATANTITNGSVVLPAPVVSIDPADYTAQPVPAPPANVEIAYVYAPAKPAPAPAPVEYLSYADARKISSRVVGIDGLDVLAYQGAAAAIWVVRNRFLFPVEASSISTTGTFLFRTPVVRFADKITPRLSYREFSLSGSWSGGATELQAVLDDFFAGLFAGGDGSTSVKVLMTSAYSYALVGGGTSWPRVRLPIGMLPPADASVTPSPAPAFTAPVAATVDTWMATNKPALEGGPLVDFGLQVFGTSGTQQPLLVVDDLTLSVTKGA